MGTLRMPEEIWKAACVHLLTGSGERFAFFLARWTYSRGEPVLMVREALLIPDSQVIAGRDGMEVGLEEVLGVINAAIKSGDCLIEAHNHGGPLPRFSYLDRRGLQEFAGYVHDSLSDRPYAATVWGDSTIYGEYFLPERRTGRLDSILVVGQRLRQIVSRDDDVAPIEASFDRQLPWFTPEGQRQLRRLRVAVVGCGGIGSPLLQNLVYLGCRDFVLIDEDVSDETSMNRLVTATAADVETAKTVLGRRLIKSVVPSARVVALNLSLQTPEALDALKGVDVIFGCVDNDGARLILNELALAYSIPYFDVASGIKTKEGKISEAGGRVAIVLLGGPCLACMGEIDAEEASYFLASPAERAEREARGYVAGMNVKAPAVISLNAAVAAAAVNEFAVFVSGLRPVNIYTDYDVLGVGRPSKSQWMSPTRIKRDTACVSCTIAGYADAVGIERYSWS